MSSVPDRRIGSALERVGKSRAKGVEQRLLTLRDAERAGDTRLAEALERLERRLGADDNNE